MKSEARKSIPAPVGEIQLLNLTASLIRMIRDPWRNTDLHLVLPHASAMCLSFFEYFYTLKIVLSII